MSETELDTQMLMVVVMVVAMVLLMARADRIRNERRERLENAIRTLVEEIA